MVSNRILEDLVNHLAKELAGKCSNITGNAGLNDLESCSVTVSALVALLGVECAKQVAIGVLTEAGTIEECKKDVTGTVVGTLNHYIEELSAITERELNEIKG